MMAIRFITCHLSLHTTKKMTILPKSKFTWILVLFMIYAYYNEYATHKTPPQNPNTAIAPNAAIISKDDSDKAKAEQNKQEETLSNKIIDKVRENETGRVLVEALVKKSLEEKYGKDDIKVIAARKTGALTIIDAIKGQGNVLNCGAEAVINYDAFMSSGIKFDSTKSTGESHPITVKIGSGQILKGLEMGIIGMREGGKRKISIPAELAFNMPEFKNTLVSKDEVVSYDVELLEIKGGPYKTGLVPDTISITEGTGNKIFCGDKVKIKYSLSNTEAAPVPEASGEVEFKLGSGTVPIGIEFAVLDMQKDGRKTLHIPHDLLISAGESILPTQIKFDKDEIIRAEIQILDVSDN